MNDWHPSKPEWIDNIPKWDEFYHCDSVERCTRCYKEKLRLLKMHESDIDDEGLFLCKECLNEIATFAHEIG